MTESSKENFLAEILERRRAHVDNAIAADPVEALRSRAGKARRRFSSALTNGGGIKVIGEFKRASPSLGVIRADADPTAIAAIYEQAGVSAISVLTEPDFFRGSLDDLRAVRAATDLPILRKDFVVAESQIDEAALAGADAVLLIVAALSDAELRRLRERAEDELGLDALVEVHAADEMERAAACGASLIGVNNRDLRTFVTSLETSVTLSALAPAGATLISESGISRSDDIARLTSCGYRGFLIGESLMRAEDPAGLIRELRGEQSSDA